MRVTIEAEELCNTFMEAVEHRRIRALASALKGDVVTARTDDGPQDKDGLTTGIGRATIGAEFKKSADQLLFAIDDHKFYVLEHSRDSEGNHRLKVTSDASKSVYGKTVPTQEDDVAMFKAGLDSQTTPAEPKRAAVSSILAL